MEGMRFPLAWETYGRRFRRGRRPAPSKPNLLAQIASFTGPKKA
jgi:hypothetical protein